MYIENEQAFDVFKMAELLSEYSVFRKILDIETNKGKYYGNSNFENDLYPFYGEKSDITVKMFEIRRFVLSLGAKNEKLFLFYHYIHGESVGRVAELMGISRRSAFRLKKRALEYAATRYPVYLKKIENSKYDDKLKF